MKAKYEEWTETRRNVKIVCPYPECEMQFFVYAAADNEVIWETQLVDYCPYCGGKLEYGEVSD